MSVTRTLMRFAFLATIGHQVTHTFVEGSIFAETRERLGRVHPKVDEFVHSHLSIGAWAGTLLAAVYRPNLLADDDGGRPGPLRQAANLAGDAFLIALGIQAWNEALGWLRRQVQANQKAIEAADGEAREDLDRPAFPGISIRPQR